MVKESFRNANDWTREGVSYCPCFPSSLSLMIRVGVKMTDEMELVSLQRNVMIKAALKVEIAQPGKYSK